MTTRTPHPGRAIHLVALALATLAISALALGALAPRAQAAVRDESYGWPVKPFDRQHPVRGWFGDPRILGASRTFHFGIDVSCPNGTLVYATLTGRAFRHPLHPDVVVVVADDGVRRFSYWHVTPLVAPGRRVVAYRTPVGRVNAPWEHVHFAEQRGDVYVNPLRPGALTPYVDRTRPVVRALSVVADGRVQPGRVASGLVDLVVEAYDETPLAIAGPWHGKPLTPALLRWRLSGAPAGVGGWHTAVDFRSTYPSSWASVYAPWTRQNKRNRVGRYRFTLVRSLDSRLLRDGRHVLEVSATDVRGNSRTVRFAVTVANL